MSELVFQVHSYRLLEATQRPLQNHEKVRFVGAVHILAPPCLMVDAGLGWTYPDLFALIEEMRLSCVRPSATYFRKTPFAAARYSDTSRDFLARS